MGIVFLGDEPTACVFRLAGVDCRVAAPGDTQDEIEALTAEGIEVLLLSSINAGALTPQYLAGLVGKGAPLVVVVDDIAGETPAPDFVAPYRRRLGVAP